MRVMTDDVEGELIELDGKKRVAVVVDGDGVLHAVPMPVEGLRMMGGWLYKTVRVETMLGVVCDGDEGRVDMTIKVSPVLANMTIKVSLLDGE